MPKSRNPYQEKIFRQSKMDAILGLAEALDEKRLPETNPREGRLYTGRITEYLDDRFLPLRRGAMLAVLREAEVPHDGQGRFLPCDLYGHQADLEKLYQEYMRQKGLDLNALRQPNKALQDQVSSEAVADYESTEEQQGAPLTT